MRRKKTSHRNTKKKQARRTKAVHRKKPARKRLLPGRSEAMGIAAVEPKGLGPRSGGQSGDIQGLSRLQIANSESVEELPEDEVPPEYRGK